MRWHLWGTAYGTLAVCVVSVPLSSAGEHPIAEAMLLIAYSAALLIGATPLALPLLFLWKKLGGNMRAIEEYWPLRLLGLVVVSIALSYATGMVQEVIGSTWEGARAAWRHVSSDSITLLARGLIFAIWAIAPRVFVTTLRPPHRRALTTHTIVRSRRP